MTSAPATLRLIPLGGLGEIGMNCMALQEGDDIVVIDCGIQFPEGDHGVDIVHPNFSWLIKHRQNVRGIVLTHGHEDHIGALPYLLQDVPVPVWGSPHALKLVEHRLAEHPLAAERVELRTFVPREPFAIAGLRFEAIRMTHSIVEAAALAIETSAGVVVHSGDFKFDPAPTDGEATDETRLQELGDRGVALLLSDSTNANSPGCSGSESEVGQALQRAIDAAPKRVFVALFASNVQRLISLGRAALQTDRRICLLGRSLSRHVEVARELGYLDWPPELVLSVERLATYPRERVLVLAGGTQAETGSAMARIADGTHRFVQIAAGDTAIFSSRVIPGNERRVSQMVARLLRRDVSIVAGSAAEVHTSGHAHREEQRRLIQLVRPASFLPVHGTLPHLHRHAELARSEGVSSVLVIENGQSVLLQDGRLGLGGAVPAGQVMIGTSGHALEDEVIRARKDLGRAGVVSVAVCLSDSGELVGEPVVRSVGVAWPERLGPNRLAHAVNGRIRELTRRRDAPTQEVLERFVRHWFVHHIGVRPQAVVHVQYPMESTT